MNTDVNQFLIFRYRFNLYIGMLISVVRKMTAYQLKPLLCWASSLPFVLTEHISSILYYVHTSIPIQENQETTTLQFKITMKHAGCCHQIYPVNLPYHSKGRAISFYMYIAAS